VPFDYESLPDVREVQIVVKFGGCPYFSDFYAAMVWRSDIDVIGLLSAIEMKFDIFKERGLISFDGKMIMGLACYQIRGKLSLC
jgi:hypothetical protein